MTMPIRSFRNPKIAPAATVAAFIAGLALVAGGVAPAFAASSPVYDSMPNPAQPNYSSLGFQAEQTSEFGDQVTLAGTNRNLQSITLGFSSWACETGTWYGTGADACVTTPGATYHHPITMNVYGINAVNATLPGALLATLTDTVAVPYRPSVSTDECPESTRWYDAATETCFSGTAFSWTFDFSAANIVLPNDVIVTVAFNTQSYGAAPLGVDGPYSSLNVGLSPTAPTLGTQDPDRVFWNTQTSDNYGDAGPTGTLREAIDSPWFASDSGAYGGLFMTINTADPAAVADNTADDEALADTGIDTVALTTGVWIGGGVLLVGAALFGIALYRRRTTRQ